MSRTILHAGKMNENGIYKVMVVKTIIGTYYVQRMEDSLGTPFWRVMKDRKIYIYIDYKNPDDACEAMLEAVRRNVLKQTEMEF